MKPATADLKTESVRAALLAIAQSHSGVLNPQVIVTAARDPLSPLHDQFEWNDDDAAELYRLAQAGALVRRVRITFVRENAGTKELHISTTRAYQSRQSQRSPDGGYEGIGAIMGDETKRGELLAQVLRELISYRKRYTELTELQEIWDALDQAKELFAPSAKTGSVSQPSASSA